MTSTNFQAPGPHFSMDASMTFRNSLSLSAATWVWNLEWTHGVPGKNRSKARANWKILEDSFTPLSNLVSAVCVVNCVYIKIFTYIQYVSYLFESFHILTNIALSLSLSISKYHTPLRHWPWLLNTCNHVPNISSVNRQKKTHLQVDKDIVSWNTGTSDTCATKRLIALGKTGNQTTATQSAPDLSQSNSFK